MATSERYLGRRKLYNAEPLYKKTLEDRGVTRILQYETPALRYPTFEEMKNLDMIPHMWRVGDHYWKLAADNYNDPQLWWVIAWFNQIPVETFIRYGDVIRIPYPIERIFQLYGL